MLVMHEPPYGGLEVIISGGQLGADQGGLEAARVLGVPTSGYAPKGYLTNRGPDLRLRDTYGLAEHASPYYPGRTRLNVASSDGTVIISSNASSPGSRMTIEAALKCQKPYLLLQPRDTAAAVEADAEKLAKFIVNNKIVKLNVAGNRDYSRDGLHFNAALKLVSAAITLLRLQDRA